MHKLKLLYSWLIHIAFYALPDVPVLMRFRGFCYSLAMKQCGRNFQVAHSSLLNTLEKITIGDNVYIANYSNIIANGDIEIGNNTLIGPSVIISSGNHIVHKGIMNKKSDIRPVFIGSNCWISANCTIVGGSKIPDGTIVAANSVWPGNIVNAAPNSLYGGTPARFIKHL